MDKKKLSVLMASLLLCGGLAISQQSVAAGETPIAAEDCKDSAAAADLVKKLIADGLSATAAMAQALQQHSCAVEAVVQAALENAPESEYATIIKTAQALAGDELQDQVVSGAILAGVDPTAYLEAPAAGPATGGAGLPGVTVRGGGGGVVSPS